MNGISDNERAKGPGYIEYISDLLVWISKDGIVTGGLNTFSV